MKKILYIALIIMIATSLFGCGKTTNTSEEASADVSMIMSDNERIYLENMLTKTNKLADALEEFERLGTNVEITNEWRTEIAEVGNLIAELGPEIADIEAPDRYINSHEVYMKAVEKTMNSLVDYFQALAEGNPKKINEFSTSWEEANKLMEEAALKLEEANSPNK